MRIIVFLVLWAVGTHALSAPPTACHPLLWPANSAVIDRSFIVPKATRLELAHAAVAYLRYPPGPIGQLGSAGQVDLLHPALIASRASFIDADRAAVLALSYALTGDEVFFNQTQAILMAWATRNKPTGHPIDESRLDSMIWAYDLVACDLSAKERQVILAWLKQMRDKKLAWRYQRLTKNNNHHVHQLKMLLLLDKVLQDEVAVKTHSEEAKALMRINLNADTGVSLDYLERDALYYHNYVLLAWLEIALLNHDFWIPSQRAYRFLIEQMSQDPIHHEFTHSNAPIDKKRAAHGFAYAQEGGTFDVLHVALTVVLYYTLNRSLAPDAEWSLVNKVHASPRMIFFKSRRALWSR